MTIEVTGVAGEGYGVSQPTTFELSVGTLTAGSPVLTGDLVIVLGVAEGNSTLTNNTAGWTEAGTVLVTRSFPGDLCRMYVWYIVATHDWDATSVTGYRVEFTSSDTAMTKKFIGHHITTTASWGSDAVVAVTGFDVTPTHDPLPTFDIDGITLTSFEHALLRVACCNDNGDEGTFDESQTFSGHTRLMILTGGEVGLISIEKDTVAAGTVDVLTLDTISVEGGEVNGIGFANIKLRESSRLQMMLLGVG